MPQCKCISWGTSGCQCKRILAKGELAFFHVRVINPFAKSHLSQKLSTAFSSSEKEKKRQYNQRIIDVEHGSFSPLVFTPYGGCGREAENVIINLAAKLAAKKDFEQSWVDQWLCTKLSFLLAILCVRGSHAIKSQVCTNLDDVNITYTRCWYNSITYYIFLCKKSIIFPLFY